ncbi:hypothetical protein TIFTF001_012085 [Ficus carica]|uniref:Uncharacterized protein n=1 Tax=Ficus carica TaxID=3494 RepID=A0AA88ABP1_FICCA|nr:hypothetical protein TIFTF001_012085 [Ficus carica]
MSLPEMKPSSLRDGCSSVIAARPSHYVSGDLSAVAISTEIQATFRENRDLISIHMHLWLMTTTRRVF